MNTHIWTIKYWKNKECSVYIYTVVANSVMEAETKVIQHLQQFTDSADFIAAVKATCPTVVYNSSITVHGGETDAGNVFVE